MPRPLPTDTICADVALHCDDELGRPLAFISTWRYRPTDPYAVSITFHVPAGEVPWLVARSLVRDGLVAATGHGDVHLSPTLDENGREAVAMVFCSPAGRMRAHASAAAIDDFLRATYDLVPDGAEGTRLDLDTLVSALRRG